MRDGPRPARRSPGARPSAGRVLLWFVGGAILAYLVLPTLIVVPLSFNDTSFFQFPPRAWSLRWYRQFFGTRAWTDALLTSVQIGLASMTVATVLGTAAAYGMTRGRMRGQPIWFGFFMAPMILPTIVFSLALYFAYSKLHLVGSFVGLVAAHAALAVPLVFLIVSAALEGMDEMIEFAALSSGAPPWKVFLLVTVPTIRPALFTASFFAFLSSFDEIVVAMFLSGSRMITLPKRMWDGIRLEINPTIAAAATILIAVSVVILLLTEVMRRRAAGGTGRA
jgi:putative spermidine/putrescine transport system permease protein